MTEREKSFHKIKRGYDSVKHSVRAEIIAACRKKPPLLAWAEPQPDWYGHGAGRHPQFNPLQRLQGVTPDWPEDLPLAEARLFWADRALHIVANEDGSCRWASIEEVPEGTPDRADSVCVNRKILPVYTLRADDLARFGLASHQYAPFPEKIDVIAYYQQGRLVAWRLTGETTHACRKN